MNAPTPDQELNQPPNVILSGICGSVAYGLATPDSDVDRIGAYAAPTGQFHGLHIPTGKSATWVSANPDVTYHEAGKLAALLLKGNPTVAELLWLNEYEVMTPLGEELIAIRSAFLSAKAVRDSYLGYATQQFTRIRNRGDGTFSSDTRKRTEKHARHLYRLLSQGVQLHQTGYLPVRLREDRARACLGFGKVVAAGDLGVAEKQLQWAREMFDRPGVLPPAPYETAAEMWLRRVRCHYWDAAPEMSLAS